MTSHQAKEVTASHNKPKYRHSEQKTAYGCIPCVLLFAVSIFRVELLEKGLFTDIVDLITAMQATSEYEQNTAHTKMHPNLLRIFATVMMGFVQFAERVSIDLSVHVAHALRKGMMLSLPGPTLLSLQHITNTDSIDNIMWIFNARGGGLIIGSFVFGFIVKDRWRSAMFGISVFATGVAFGFAPWCQSLTTILVAFFVTGLGMGFSIASGNFFIVKMWGDKSPACLSSVFGCFIIGAAVSPLIAIPFLPGEPAPDFNTTTRELETDSTNGSNLAEVTKIPLDFSLRRNVKIETLYFIIMAITCASGAGLACGSALVSHGAHSSSDFKNEKEKSIVPPGAVYIFTACFMFLFIMVSVGLEFNFYGMVSAYIVLGMNGTKQEGTVMVSYFWGIYAIFSCVGIATSNYFTAPTLLLVNLAVITAANVFLVFSDPTWVTLWVGTTFLSIGFGSTYAGVFIWGDFYLELSPAMSAVLVAGGELGSVVVTVVTGYFFAADPFSLMKITMVCTLICDVLFVLVEVILYRYVRVTRPTSLGLRKLRETGYDNLKN